MLPLLPPESLFALGLFAVSGGILMLRWPKLTRRHSNIPLIVAVLCALISLWLSAQLATVGYSWFALGQKYALLSSPDPTPLARSGPPAGFAVLAWFDDSLSLVAARTLPPLSLNLVANGVLLAAYLALKFSVVVSAWLLGKSDRPGKSGTGHSLFDAMLLGLGLGLGGLAYLAEIHPVFARFTDTVVWAGMWIVLLELRSYIVDRVQGESAAIFRRSRIPP